MSYLVTELSTLALRFSRDAVAFKFLTIALGTTRM